MPQYLLAVHAGGPPPDHDPDAAPPPSPEAMQAMMQPILDLEEQLVAEGAWLFSGRLSDPGSATVVRDDDGDTLLTDGPYVESKEHLAGFYVIEADDLDDALAWAGRVTACVGSPIEVRPLVATGRARDHMPA